VNLGKTVFPGVSIGSFSALSVEPYGESNEAAAKAGVHAVLSVLSL